MTHSQAKAEVFLLALKSLPKKEKDEVLARIARDKEFSPGLLDLLTIADRQEEPSRPFRKYLSEKKKK